MQVKIPDDIAHDLANVSVQLKLRLHEADEMIITDQVCYDHRWHLAIFFKLYISH